MSDLAFSLVDTALPNSTSHLDHWRVCRNHCLHRCSMFNID